MSLPPAAFMSANNGSAAAESRCRTASVTTRISARPRRNNPRTGQHYANLGNNAVDDISLSADSVKQNIHLARSERIRSDFGKHGLAGCKS